MKDVRGTVRRLGPKGQPPLGRQWKGQAREEVCVCVCVLRVWLLSHTGAVVWLVFL